MYILNFHMKLCNMLQFSVPLYHIIKAFYSYTSLISERNVNKIITIF